MLEHLINMSRLDSLISTSKRPDGAWWQTGKISLEHGINKSRVDLFISTENF